MVIRLIIISSFIGLISCATHQDLLAPQETGRLSNVNHQWQTTDTSKDIKETK